MVETLPRMAKKRLLAPPPSPTDEWGIYDPAKAGMQALYTRLGRPVIRASAASTRRERKRAGRPDRSADGVGMAIQEARRRAEVLAKANGAPPPVPPVPMPPAAPEVAAPVARTTRAKGPKGLKRGPLGAAIAAAGAKTVAPVARPAAVPEPPQIATAAGPGALATPPRRASKKGKKATQATGHDGAPARSTPAVPPPSPRRPRGPVPLAAWAHAVSDSPRPEPKRAEGKGLWRGIFTIPSEVALVEYRPRLPHPPTGHRDGARRHLGSLLMLEAARG